MDRLGSSQDIVYLDNPTESEQNFVSQSCCLGLSFRAKRLNNYSINIEKFPKLQALYLTVFPYYSSFDMQKIANSCPSLTSLTVEGSAIEIDTLSAFKKLETLRLEENHGCSCVTKDGYRGYCDIPNGENGATCEGAEEDWKQFYKAAPLASSLQSLEIIDPNHLYQSLIQYGCPNLERLLLKEIDDLENVNFLKDHRHLETISIVDCHFLEDISAFLEMPALKSVYIEDCFHIDMQSIDALKTKGIDVTLQNNPD